jgi:hypothetical protein
MSSSSGRVLSGMVASMWRVTGTRPREGPDESLRAPPVDMVRLDVGRYAAYRVWGRTGVAAVGVTSCSAAEEDRMR